MSRRTIFPLCVLGSCSFTATTDFGRNAGPSEYLRQIGVYVALRISPDAARHRRRGFRARKVAGGARRDTIAGIVQNLRGHPRRGTSQRTRLQRLNRQREQKASDDLCSAGNVDDRNAPPADVFEKPQIRRNARDGLRFSPSQTIAGFFRRTCRSRQLRTIFSFPPVNHRAHSTPADASST